MARTLDILIPMYNEGFEMVKPLLDTIQLQQGIDLNEVGVIICCDGGTTDITKDQLEPYSFHTEFHKCDHHGVSATRNKCLEYSTAKYVSFSDCDDMYMNMCGLYIVFREINELNGFDVLVSVFTEETRDPKYPDKPVFINHDMDTTFVHGKFFRRQYLIDNNIKFDPSLTIHEDSYFNCLAQRLASKDNVKYCPQPFYLWRWNSDSVCRHDKKYLLKTFNNMIDSNTSLIEQFTSRKKYDEVKYFICALVYESYFTLNLDEWISQENQEYRYNTELRFKKYWFTYKDKFNELTKEEKTMIASGMRQRKYAEGLLNESITFDDFINRIENLEDK